jgi:hypothetical protein
VTLRHYVSGSRRFEATCRLPEPSTLEEERDRFLRNVDNRSFASQNGNSYVQCLNKNTNPDKWLLPNDLRLKPDQTSHTVFTSQSTSDYPDFGVFVAIQFSSKDFAAITFFYITSSSTFTLHIRKSTDHCSITQCLSRCTVCFWRDSPPVGQGLLDHEVSRSHTTTHHNR